MSAAKQAQKNDQALPGFPRRANPPDVLVLALPSGKHTENY